MDLTKIRQAMAASAIALGMPLGLLETTYHPPVKLTGDELKTSVAEIVTAGRNVSHGSSAVGGIQRVLTTDNFSNPAGRMALSVTNRKPMIATHAGGGQAPKQQQLQRPKSGADNTAGVNLTLRSGPKGPTHVGSGV